MERKDQTIINHRKVKLNDQLVFHGITAVSEILSVTLLFLKCKIQFSALYFIFFMKMAKIATF